MSLPDDADRKKFRPYDPDAPLAMPRELREWLPADHLVYLISDVVDELDLSPIYAHYEKARRGQPPYDPRLMVKLLIYGYTTGIPNSRRIEKKTYEDIAFRVLTVRPAQRQAQLGVWLSSPPTASGDSVCCRAPLWEGEKGGRTHLLLHVEVNHEARPANASKTCTLR